MISKALGAADPAAYLSIEILALLQAGRILDINGRIV
jgi:hypothetical protein